MTLSTESKFTLQTWLVMCFGLLLLTASAAQLLYRLTLPTDGWSYEAGTFSEDVSQQYLFLENIVESVSPIQPGDGLLAYSGLAVAEQNEKFSVLSRPTDWFAGSIVQYTVSRNGETLTLDVPIKDWTWNALIQYSAGNLLYLLGDLLLFGVGFFTLVVRPNTLAARVLFIFGAVSLAIGISGLLPDGVTVMFEPVAFYGSSFLVM